MIGSSTIGPNSPIEQVLADYGIDASSWTEDIVENDTERLLLALLLEQRGENAVEALNPESEDTQEAAYFVTEEPLPVTSTEENRLKWGYPATSVTVWGFDEPIYVAFRSEFDEPIYVAFRSEFDEPIYVAFRSEGDYRKIPLEPSGSPYHAGPEGGLGASAAWISKQSSETNDTTVKVKAYK
ncbi:hypothetical protein [Natrialba asiatica]|uniref:Uncharacterized protein n=1 Tax=Natrialba asiatica (strain ATCC 700177 / DSM 12278 / JCM 9576 / FERM P-10747 / NBRC 102637 / 172P1) TaxID=29540 RepID=M0AQ22_NATA1|nr:hypothetical protein [Natrialba asiatica]ELY99478.1 hypothetical protein C481_14633 [Natrialba asiatica DSM 12278]